jgi:ankyrin repeat protein
MPPKRKAQVPAVELPQEHSQDQESTNKRANSTKGKKQQQQQQPGLNLDGDDAIITQFKPVKGQWKLNNDNLKRIDPKTGETILHNYCKYVNTTPLAVYQYLIETKGCDINALNKDKGTPIHDGLNTFDSDSGDIAVLIYLLSKGGGVNTLLHHACINKLPLKIVKLLIETHGGDINAQNDDNDTPIHIAFRRYDPYFDDCTSLLTYLIGQKNVNVNIKGKDGSTLLHLACKGISSNFLSIDIFETLIETHGADINAQDDAGDTPIHVAFRCYDLEYEGDCDDYESGTLIYLINQKNVDVNIKNNNGETLLHKACSNINNLSLDVFKVLIETLGCDVEALNNEQDTPFHAALLRFDRYSDMKNISTQNLEYLLTQKGVNSNIKGYDGYTLLHQACECTHSLPLEVYKLLIEIHGCDVNTQNNRKNTPILSAFHHFEPDDDINILTYLMSQKNVNINIKGEDGCTILHSACKNNIGEAETDECDDIFSQMVESIAERCIQQVLDEITTP